MKRSAYILDLTADHDDMPADEPDDGVIHMTRDDLVAEIQAVTMRRTGRTALDVLADYRAGQLKDPGQIGDVLIVAGLLDSADPYSAR